MKKKATAKIAAMTEAKAVVSKSGRSRSYTRAQ